MDRLTYRMSDGTVNYHGCITQLEMAERLAEYEDTGYEPREISNMNQQYQRAVKVQDELRAYKDTGLTPEEIESYKRLFDYIDPSSGLPDGVKAFNHLRELAEADKDGRCLTTPCKVGDTVYDISNGTVYETRVLGFYMTVDGHVSCRCVSCWPDLHEFGKRIFLSYDKAEAALSEAKHHAITVPNHNHEVSRKEARRDD